MAITIGNQMNFRLLYLLFRWYFLTKPLKNPLDTTSLNFKVTPFDIDYNLHLNNAKYLSLMDLGRMHMTVKMGLYKKMFQNKWQAVAAGVNIMYRRPIAPFAKFTLETKILCWDSKWFYIEQDFLSKGQVCARAIVRVGFVDKKLMDPQIIVDATGYDIKSPEMPEYLKELTTGEKHFIEYTKNH